MGPEKDESYCRLCRRCTYRNLRKSEIRLFLKMLTEYHEFPKTKIMRLPRQRGNNKSSTERSNNPFRRNRTPYKRGTQQRGDDRPERPQKHESRNILVQDLGQPGRIAYCTKWLEVCESTRYLYCVGKYLSLTQFMFCTSSRSGGWRSSKS